MAGPRALLVPIRVECLWVEKDGLQLGPPLADFSKLPYYLADGSTRNASRPNLAESAFSQNAPLSFPKGLHVHWALPDALTTAHHRDGSATFPAVPNRWLVRRLDGYDAKLQTSTIVESDFLHPVDASGAPTYARPAAGTPDWPPIAFPTKRLTLGNQKPGAAFRYMGRALPLDQWLIPSTGNEYLNQRDGNSAYKFSSYPLTAVGYGEPAFAAHYPSCRSVFGFLDADSVLKTTEFYLYQVFGWFNERDLDPLQSPEFLALASDHGRYEALRYEYGWELPRTGAKDPGANDPAPTISLYYGAVLVGLGTGQAWQPPDDSTLRIAVGNTGGEALAALLADGLAAQQSADKVVIEDQLEAMNLASALQGVEVDYAAHFAQTRHQRGFRGLAGGGRWAVRPRSPQPRPTSAAEASERMGMGALPPLPDAVAHALDALNTAHEAYNMAQQEIAERRIQTFCDWHKFLTAYYTDAPDLAPYRSQADHLGKFIGQQTLQLLTDKLSLAGTLVLTKDTAQAEGVVSATLTLATGILAPAQPANQTLAVQVLLRLKALIDQVSAAGIAGQFEIANLPAEHFWRPREPVVLIASPAADTPQFGPDDKHPCITVDLPDVPGSKAFVGVVDAISLAAVNLPYIVLQGDPPWYPIILEWSASLSSVKTGRTANKAIDGRLDYAPTFVTDSFQLEANEPDFTRPKGLSLLDGNTYEGRCVLTPSAGPQLDVSLRTFLLRTTLDDCRDRDASGEADYLDRLINWYRPYHPGEAPSADPERAAWLKLQRPFLDPWNKDGPPRLLLPIADLVTWYGKKPVKGANNTVGTSWDSTKQGQDPIYSALRALLHLNDVPMLSQALGGFNAALLTRAQRLQIPIENPLEDALSPTPLRDLNLTANVAQAVDRHHPVAPLAGKVFSPIRSGTLTLDKVSLVDAFGRRWDPSIGAARLVTSNGLLDPDQRTHVTYLPPRVSAPARLNFRWLAATSGQNGVDEVEMSSVPATTPVCGWLLPNRFDNSVMVYDGAGKALGSINLFAEWMPAPGTTDRIAAAEIANPHLRRLIRRLVVDVGTRKDEIAIRQAFVESFLSTLDSAFEAIEPASFAQHEALALLIGRPIAVVRAQVDLQIMGQPTDADTIDDPTIAGGKAIRVRRSALWKAFVDQDWGAFAYDWGRFYGCSTGQILGATCPFSDVNRSAYARTTHGLEQVIVPMRLGEHQLLNDGLIGFWKERVDGELDNVFHVTQALQDLEIGADVTFQEGRVTPCISAYTAGVTDNLRLTLQDDPQALTLLMDPRGIVHATTGILPVAQLQIPSACYADALRQMSVTFRVSPILTDAEALHVALPKEAGFTWSWVTKSNGSTWEETRVIAEATEHAHFFTPKIAEGWLKLTPSARRTRS